MSSTAAGRPGSGPVEKAAREVLDTGLRHGGSAFTPDRAIWTTEAADELDRAYVQRPEVGGGGNFLQKLRAQLHGADPAAIQLAAELLYLNAVPLSNVSGQAKRSRINGVLSWLPEPVEIPPGLDSALDSGVFSGGVGFNTMLWSQLVHLVAFVQDWWQQPAAAREEALADPWAWKAFVESVGGGNAPSQRNALKYLAFPETFQPIVNVSHRQRIREAYKSLLPGTSGDIDRDLRAIHDKLQAQSPDKPVDFYVAPWASAWKGASVPAGRHAWLVRLPTGDQATVVERWLKDGVAALAATKLRTLSAGASLSTIRDAVSADYSAVEYVRQAELAGAFHTFLSVMDSGDVVVTVAGDAVHLGVVEEGAPWFDAADAVGRLRRKVGWRTADAALPVAQLPAPLPTHLATQGSVVDLSEDLDLLLTLLQNDDDTDDGPAVDLPARNQVVIEGPPPLTPATDELAERLHVDKPFLQEWIDLLTDRQQVIFYGPPGTGKTYLAERLARFLADAGDLESERVVLVQFHPSTSYEDFVEGYRPDKPDRGGQLRFELTAGPLSRIASAAREDPSRPYFLIVDEINRANLAKVFGELYYLLEYRDSGIRLLYRPDKPYTLPGNLFLIGTMNTADRSIALVDAAMRRRFAFVELHPDDEPVHGLLRRWLAGGRKDAARADLLDALNARIEDRDFKIGPSYLMKADAERDGGLDRVWRYSIVPLLVEHHYGRLSPSQVEAKYGLTALQADLPAPGSPADELAEEPAPPASPDAPA
jgi:5-methylcytosine-specific restriction protein B